MEQVILNLHSLVRPSKLSLEDNLFHLLKKYEEIRPFLGSSVLLNTGEIKKTKEFKNGILINNVSFSIAKEDERRLYPQGKDFFSAYSYIIDNDGKLFIGHQKEDGTIIPTYTYDMNPVYNIPTLYEKHGIKTNKGFFKKTENIEAKLDFLINFLREEDLIIEKNWNKEKLLEELEKKYLQNSISYAKRYMF